MWENLGPDLEKKLRGDKENLSKDIQFCQRPKPKRIGKILNGHAPTGSLQVGSQATMPSTRSLDDCCQVMTDLF